MAIIYVDDGSKTGKVICKRHIDSYFMSSAEILSMARFQLAHPYKTPISRENNFGSRFVTVVVSGIKHLMVLNYLFTF